MKQSAMSRSRAATPAGKRRSGARRGRAAPRAKAKPTAAARSAASAPRRPATKRRAKPALAKRPHRAVARRRRRPRRGAPRRTAPRPARWSRPRPLRALRRRFSARLVALAARVVLVLAADLAAGYFSGCATPPWSRSPTSRSSAYSAATPRGSRRADPGRRGPDHAARRPGRDRAGRRGLPDVESVSVDPELPPRDEDRGHRASAGDAGQGRRRARSRRPPTGRCSPGSRSTTTADLPVLEVGELPARRRARGRSAAAGADRRRRARAAAPADRGGRDDDEYGVEVTLRGGIPVRFGSGSRAAEKWAAAAGRARRSEAGLARPTRRPRARAAGGRRARRPADAQLSTQSRDFRKYVEPSTQSREFGGARFRAGDRTSIDTDATMPYRRPHV